MKQNNIKHGHFRFDALMVAHITLLVASGVAFHREVLIYKLTVSGGMLIIPFCFGISYLFCRLYGMKEYYKLLLNSLISLIAFALLTYTLIELPSSILGNSTKAYLKIFGNILALYALFGSAYSLLSIAANQSLKITHNLLFSLTTNILSLLIFNIILNSFLKTFHKSYSPFTKAELLSLTPPIMICMAIFSAIPILITLLDNPEK